MPRYRWTSDRPLIRTDGENVERDGTFEASESIERHFGDRLEPADDEDTEAEAAADEGGDDIDELLDGTVAEVADALDTGEYDGRLDEIEARDDRQGVQDAVEDRREG